MPCDDNIGVAGPHPLQQTAIGRPRPTGECRDVVVREHVDNRPPPTRREAGAVLGLSFHAEAAPVRSREIRA
jgi:hypothetical protein